MKKTFYYKTILVFGYLILTTFKLFAQTQQPDSLLNKPIIDTTTTQANINLPERQTEPKFITFSKPIANHGPDSILFNLLTITNIESNPIEGTVSLNVPDKWQVTGTILNGVKVKLQPGESQKIPFWITIDKEAKGDYSYVLTAKLDFTTERKPAISSAYVKIPKFSNWQLIVPQNVVYFNIRYRYASFEIKLQNNGNAPEPIQLNFKAGQSIRVRNFEFPEDEFFLELQPNTDTTMTFEVRYEEPESEKTVTTGKENNLTITAIGGSKKVKSIVFQKLPSYYKNPVANSVYTPLTIEVLSQNVLSALDPVLNVYLYGEILLPNENQDITYRFGFLNASNNGPFGLAGNLWRYSFMQVRLRYNKFTLELGDVGHSGFDLRRTARGGKLTYQLAKTHQVAASYGQSIFIPFTTYGVEYSGSLPAGISLKAGISKVNDRFNRIDLESGGAQVGFKIFKTQSLTLRYGQSRRIHLYNIGDFPVVEDANQTFTGYHVGGDHSFSFKKFTSLTSIDLYSPYHAGNINNTINMRNAITLRLSDKNYINTNLSHINTYQYFILGGRRVPSPQFELTSARLIFNQRLSAKLNMGFGGLANNSKLTNFYPLLNSRFTNETNNYAVNTKASFKLSGLSSFSLFYERGFYQPIAIYQDPRFISTFDLSKLYPSSRFSASYRFNQSGVTAVFIKGILNPTQIQNLSTLGENQTFMLRPFFNKSFLEGKFLLETFGNVLLQTASKTENYSLNVRPQFFFNRGWSAKAFINYNISSRQFSEDQSISSRSLFVTVGIKKQFDIQQPRVKYYNLTVVYFKDLNGNGVREEGEPFLENVITRISRVNTPKKQKPNIDGMKKHRNSGKIIYYTDQNNNNNYDDGEPYVNDINGEEYQGPKGKFQELEMISDKEGKLTYNKIPEGDFLIYFFSLEKLAGFYNPNGNSQQIKIFSNTTIYIPLMEGLKIKGSVVVERDPNSSLGKLPLENIPITATDNSGNILKGLTNSRGHFQVFVPPTAGFYKVTLANVFGENYIIEQESFEVNFDGLKTFEITFKVVEKSRAINIKGGYNFQSLLGQNTKPEDNKEEVQKETTNTITPVKAEPTQPVENNLNTTNKSTIDKTAEDELRQKTNDLQRQIDELKALKEAIEQLKIENEKALQEIKNIQNQPPPPAPINTMPQTSPTAQPGIVVTEKEYTLVSYRVELGVFKEQMPTNALNNLIKLGSTENGQTADGAARFLSKPFYDLQEARDYAEKLKTQGFENARIVGDDAGKEIPVEEVERLLNKQ